MFLNTLSFIPVEGSFWEGLSIETLISEHMERKL